MLSLKGFVIKISDLMIAILKRGLKLFKLNLHLKVPHQSAPAFF